MELKRDPLLQVNEDVKRVQTRLNYICGSWPRLVEDGKFGPQTENAVVEYQKSRHLLPKTLGEIDDMTYAILMNERYSIITNASPYSKVNLEISSYRYGNIITGVKTTYDYISTPIGKIQSINEWIDPSEGRFAFVINEWEKAIKRIHDGLLRRLNKFPQKATMRVRNVIKQLKSCEKFFKEAQRYGINTASKVFGNSLTKEQAIKYISDLGKAIANSKLTKFFGTLSRAMKGIKQILQPIVKILNKVPGLKYLSVYDKIVEGTYALVRMDFDKAFVAYLDGLRLLVEQILIDAVVVSLVAAGGWVALVIAIAVLAMAFLVDYFLFNDDPENSWLPTTHLTTKVKPAIEVGMYQFGRREMQRDRENLWRGPKY